MEGTLVPEAIAAVAAAALLVALAMASGRQRSAKETGRCAGGWRPSAVHGIVEPPVRLQHGSYHAAHVKRCKNIDGVCPDDE